MSTADMRRERWTIPTRRERLMVVGMLLSLAVNVRALPAAQR